MIAMADWYRMHDASPAGVVRVAKDDAESWNAQGFGIFWTVNSFDGPRRIEHCTSIDAWAVDLDEGTKRQQWRRLLRSPLIPSSIVETKSGFHVYWRADGGRVEYYRPIVDRLVDYFAGDPNARDVARILRVPGFRHLKVPEDPFLVRYVYGPHRRSYTELQMWRAFPPVLCPAKEQHEHVRREYVAPGGAGDDLWDRIYNLDQREGLRRLSGSRHVGGEEYSFRPVPGGRHNILADGKGTSCWIDAAGRIGSRDRGGPTVVQWLAWFGLPRMDCVAVVRDLFPELTDD